MIVSTLYLPETTANVRHQYVPSRSICADQTNCPVMAGAVQQRVLIIARSQVSCPALGQVRRSAHRRGRSPPRTPAGLWDL
jgi:hypothetical protein